MNPGYLHQLSEAGSGTDTGPFLNLHEIAVTPCSRFSARQQYRTRSRLAFCTCSREAVMKESQRETRSVLELRVTGPHAAPPRLPKGLH